MEVPPPGAEGAARAALNALDAAQMAAAAQRAQDLQLAAADAGCKLCELIVQKLQDGPAGSRRALLTEDEVKHLQELRRRKLELLRATQSTDAANAPAATGDEQKRNSPQQQPQKKPDRPGSLDTLA